MDMWECPSCSKQLPNTQAGCSCGYNWFARSKSAGARPWARDRSNSRENPSQGNDKDSVSQIVAKIPPATPDMARSEQYKHTYVKSPPEDQKEAVARHRRDVKKKIRKDGILMKSSAAAGRPPNEADQVEISILKYMLTESSGSENQLSEARIQLEKEQGKLREIKQKESEVREKRIKIE